MSAIDQLISVVPKSEHSVEIKGIKLELKQLSLMSAIKLIRHFPDALKAIFGDADLIKMATDL